MIPLQQLQKSEFHSNEDPLHCYHKSYFKQDRSPQLHNTLQQMSNVSININKRSNFYSHDKNKLPLGESKELKAECEVVKTSKLLRQLQREKTSGWQKFKQKENRNLSFQKVWFQKIFLIIYAILICKNLIIPSHLK